MRKLIISALLGLFAAGWAMNPASAQRSRVRLPEGAEIRMRTLDSLSSKTANEGDEIRLITSDPVRYNGVVIIPDGSTVVGRVAMVRHRGVFGRSGKLEIKVESVKVGESRIRLRGGKASNGKGQGTLSIATAVLVAPIAGVITGKSAVIPAGTEFTAYTDQDY